MWAKNFTNFSDLIELIKGISRWNNLTSRHIPIEQFESQSNMVISQTFTVRHGLMSSLSELNFWANLQTFSVHDQNFLVSKIGLSRGS